MKTTRKYRVELSYLRTIVALMGAFAANIATSFAFTQTPEEALISRCSNKQSSPQCLAACDHGLIVYPGTPEYAATYKCGADCSTKAYRDCYQAGLRVIDSSAAQTPRSYSIDGSTRARVASQATRGLKPEPARKEKEAKDATQRIRTTSSLSAVHSPQAMSTLSAGPTLDKAKTSMSSMRTASTPAIVEGSGSGTNSAVVQTGSSGGAPNAAQGSGCSEPGPGGSVSVPCSILGIFPPSNPQSPVPSRPQYSPVPAASDSAPLWRVDPSPAELYAELNAATSAAQLVGAAIDMALQPPSADVPILGDATELPQSFIPGPPLGGPGSPGWEPGSPGWEPDAVPIHPEAILGPLYPPGSVGAAFSAAAAIDQVASSDQAHAYSTMSAEAAKASTDPISTNIAINLGMMASSIPYVGPALAPGVALSAKWIASQAGGAAVDSTADWLVEKSGAADPFGLQPTSSLGNMDAPLSDAPLAPLHNVGKRIGKQYSHALGVEGLYGDDVYKIFLCTRTDRS
jgi:hypothetical protein